MNKELIYYFYVHKTGWNDLYNIHFYYLEKYKDRFDAQTFIIATDNDTPAEHIHNVERAIINIFPSAKIIYYPNDKELRESNYFYNEIALKLDDFDDKWYFFSHNKGVDTYYTTKEVCEFWIEAMYFMNLNYMNDIEKQMNGDTAVIGTFLIRNLKAWSWLKYNWHFSGTYWWFRPHKVNAIIKENKSSFPANSRYFTEGFFGSVIPDDHRYVKPSLDIYNANYRQKTNWMSRHIRKDFMYINNDVKSNGKDYYTREPEKIKRKKITVINLTEDENNKIQSN